MSNDIDMGDDSILPEDDRRIAPENKGDEMQQDSNSSSFPFSYSINSESLNHYLFANHSIDPADCGGYDDSFLAEIAELFLIEKKNRIYESKITQYQEEVIVLINDGEFKSIVRLDELGYYIDSLDLKINLEALETAIDRLMPRFNIFKKEFLLPIQCAIEAIPEPETSNQTKEEKKAEKERVVWYSQIRNLLFPNLTGNSRTWWELDNSDIYSMQSNKRRRLNNGKIEQKFNYQYD